MGRLQVSRVDPVQGHCSRWPRTAAGAGVEELDRVEHGLDRGPGAGVVGLVAPLAGPDPDRAQADRGGAGDVLGRTVPDVDRVSRIDPEGAEGDVKREPVGFAVGAARSIGGFGFALEDPHSGKMPIIPVMSTTP
jgi:hypothetical protein